MPSQAPSNTAGRWFLAVIGLSLAVMGGLFFWLMWRSFDRARLMHQWPEVPCTILASEVEERRIDPSSPAEFRLNLVFGYEWDGARLTGDRITWRGNPWTSKRNVIDAQVEQYPAGLATTCRVNPEDPDFAILQPDSKAPGYSIWFPALFVIGGLGITVKAALPKRLHAENKS